MGKWSKVHAWVKEDPKSPLRGVRHYLYEVSAEGAGWSCVALVSGFNVADARRHYRRSNKKFRHEVRMLGGKVSQYPINVKRVNKRDR
jgi:hypothetical protein